jgi:hypothetical protein
MVQRSQDFIKKNKEMFKPFLIKKCKKDGKFLYETY